MFRFWLAAPLVFHALVLPVQASPAGFTDQDRADAICVMSVSALLGSASDDQLTPEMKAGLSSVLTYFVGKLKGRHPALAMTDLLSPDHVLSLQGEIPASAKRCSQEAMEMGTDLQNAAQILIDLDRPPAATS